MLDRLLNPDVAIHNKAWLMYNFLWCLPALYITVWKLFNQQSYAFAILPGEKREQGKPLKADKFDGLFRLYCIGGIINYYVDTAYIWYYYGLSMDFCILAMFLHHIVCIAGSYPLATIAHYPWFICAPLAWHTLIILNPYTTALHPPYGVLFILFLWGVCFDPWCRDWRCRWLVRTTVPIAAPLLMMSLEGCEENGLDY